MKIALLGYGKMGKEIEKIALERGHTIHLIIDTESDWEKANLKECDVAIEFSIPEKAIENIYKCINSRTPIVVGTTGWYAQLEEIKIKIEEEKSTLFFASNFSIGVNITFELNKKLANLLNGYPEYEVNIEETHHIHKLDAPSGTAITIADQIIENIDRKDKWKLDDSSDNKDLVIKSYREDEVPGTHIINYKSEIDSISLKHEAYSRKGFALGAVLAAEFANKNSGFLTMQDLLFS